MPNKEEPKKQNLTTDLKRLSAISEWFEAQEEVDVEEGLKKVKEAASLIKASKARLKAVENEFEEIKKEIGLRGEEEKEKDDEVDAKDIPF